MDPGATSLDDPRQLGILQHVGLAYRLAEGRGCGLDASDRLDGRTEGITGPLGDSEDPQRHPGRPRIFLDGHVAGQAQHHPWRRDPLPLQAHRCCRFQQACLHAPEARQGGVCQQDPLEPSGKGFGAKQE